MANAAPSPCLACPWHASNWSKPTPGGWYSRKNLKRLWAGLRRGERMSCHPTDPQMNDVEGDGYDGFRAAPEGTEARECAGALILVQREFMHLQRTFHANIGEYRRARPSGLTRSGIMAILERAVLVMPGQKPMPKPNLNEEDIEHPTLTWNRADWRKE